MEDTVINIFKSGSISKADYTHLWVEFITKHERNEPSLLLKNEE